MVTLSNEGDKILSHFMKGLHISILVTHRFFQLKSDKLRTLFNSKKNNKCGLVQAVFHSFAIN